MQRFQSILQFKKVSCKNCYKCVRNCPVKAIRVHDHQARIIESQCIYCEKCILVCPQDAKEEQNMIPAICNAMENKTQVIASLHPAYLARFGVTGINGIREAMKKLGFADAADAAEGASLMISQYRALFAEQKEPGIMISSACPVIVQLVKKHYPHLLGNLVQSASMMQFHASYLKKKYPSLTDLLGAVKGIRRLSVSGMEQCREVLEELHPEDFENCFLEMYACSGGCVAGPSFQMKKGHYLADVLAVKNAAFGKDFHREQGDYELPGFELRKNFGYCPAQEQEEVSEEEIRDALAEMGKFSPKDELNCGACGYNTCREKAIAIIQNKAEVAMCIPYMRAKQESYSNKVFNAMPGLLVTVDYNLKIIQMNEAASKLFNMPKKRRLIGKPVSEIMDDYSLASILAFERNLMQDEIYLEDQKCYLDRVMTNDKENKMILCIMKDITKERKHKDQIHNAQIEAARMADKLVEEQLKIVQQIAGLLGETAADTKVAVEKLKNTILLESEEENEKK